MIGAGHDDSIMIILIPMTTPFGLELANEQDPSESYMRNDVGKIRSDVVLRVMVEGDEFRSSFVRIRELDCPQMINLGINSVHAAPLIEVKLLHEIDVAEPLLAQTGPRKVETELE
jgi:hypothetical protein